VWEVQTTAYSYWLLDRQANELLLYQWVASERNRVATPHLHIRALTRLTGANPSEEQLPTETKAALDLLVSAHLPTGHITFAEILRMACHLQRLLSNRRSRLEGSASEARAPREVGLTRQVLGRMFWFIRKRLPGSYFALSATSRS